MAKVRLDQLLVQRGAAADRKEAVALIMRGLVLVEGRRVDKPGSLAPEDAAIRVRPRARYASRGGDKLETALSVSGIDPDGKVCLDLGSSTGGFTDCLLQHGAQRVYAFDVGRGQLDWRLRHDPRVEVHEQVNVRFLNADQIEEAPDLITIDLSFISLRLILPQLVQFGSVDILALVKPQFEAERGEVEKGGVIRDSELRRRIVDRVRAFAQEQRFRVLAEIPSPIPGAKGNREVFLWLRSARG